MEHFECTAVLGEDTTRFCQPLSWSREIEFLLRYSTNVGFNFTVPFLIIVFGMLLGFLLYRRDLRRRHSTWVIPMFLGVLFGCLQLYAQVYVCKPMCALANPEQITELPQD